MKKNKGKGKVIRTAIYLVIFVAMLCLLCIPLFRDLKFGLDLQGGFEILYKVESIDGSRMTHDKVMATYKTLSKRIDSLGVMEPEIIIEGNDQIRVKLAGVTNPEEARKQLSTVATLSFRDTDDNLLMTSDVLESGGAKVSQDQSGKPAVALSVKDKEEFYKVTNKVKDYDQNMIVIWLDYNEEEDSFASESSMCGTEESNCLSAATVSQGFASDVIIQGDFSEEEVENLVDLINSGSLPSKLTEISSNTVGASFGDNTLQTTFIAGVIGISLVILFLLLTYHFAGFVSAIMMLIYTFLVFVVFWVVGGVLTLPGIAALILGIGTAVDSNIVTFARIKDELYRGKSLPNAYKEGTKESLSAIIDANVIGLLVAVIMFIFGESSIKGFATMQIITIFVIMFTMVWLTRVLLKLFVKTGYFNDKTKLFINVKKEDIPDVSKNEEVKVVPLKNFNFFKYTKQFVGLSIFIMVAGIVMYFAQGFNLSVDYQSGTDISIVTEEKVTSKELNKDLKELGLEKRSIEVGDEETKILVNDVLEGNEVDEVTHYFEDKYEAKTNIGVVSNIVQQELVKNAILSVIISLAGIILYISIRFKFSYAVGGVVSLLHDVLFIFALFTILHLEISTMFIAAILAIIGYSINDTIVTFDRIREELGNISEKKMTKKTIWDVTNRAVCETFVRTVHTFIATLIPIVVLIFLGSKEILTFNLAMLFGFIAGAYSSIYIAAVIFAAIESRSVGKPKKQKRIYTDEYEEKMVKGVNC